MKQSIMNIDVPKVLETEAFGNALGVWLLSAVAALAIIIVLLAIRGFLGSHLRDARLGDHFDWRYLTRDLIYRTNLLFILILGLYLGSRLLSLPAQAEAVIIPVFVVALFIQAALWADRVVESVMRWQVGRHANGGVRSALALLQFMGRVAVWSLALLLILSNLGFDITALVAGLGIGGVAVALAAQNILGDLFASLSIVLDRPFEVGDFIVFSDTHMGTVEKIGIKTTRIRSLSGEQLICSNNDLLSSRIHNYKRMQERRVVFTVGVTYETPRKALGEISGMLKQIIEDQKEKTRLDRAHLSQLGDSAILFEVVYWVMSADYSVYMDVQQNINLAIVDRFAAEGIELAYPTQTIHIYESQKRRTESNGPTAAKTAAVP